MDIKPQIGRRNYAKGGRVKGYARGGGIDPFMNLDANPGGGVAPGYAFQPTSGSLGGVQGSEMRKAQRQQTLEALKPIEEAAEKRYYQSQGMMD